MRRTIVGAAWMLGTAACGTLTGLSDDYTFDLEAGATPPGAADGAPADAAPVPVDATTDARPTTDAGQCTASQSKATSDFLSGANGSLECKACLDTTCCAVVAGCVTGNGCKNRLECDLKCSNQGGGGRSSCLANCMQSEPTTSSAWTAVTACDCQSTCGAW